MMNNCTEGQSISPRCGKISDLDSCVALGNLAAPVNKFIKWTAGCFRLQRQSNARKLKISEHLSMINETSWQSQY